LGQEYGFNPRKPGAKMAEEHLVALLYSLGFFREVSKRDEDLYCSMIQLLSRESELSPE
jgi:hypothetical protein